MDFTSYLARRILSTLLAVAAPMSLIAQQSPFRTLIPSPPPPPSRADQYAVISKAMFDPSYATMYGGSGNDELLGQATSGDIACMVGVTNSTDLVLFTPFQADIGGGFDGWIGCGNATTTLPTFASYLGSDGDESIVAADILDDTLYVVGLSTSETLPGTDGAYQETGGGGQDCFVSRVSIVDGSGLKTTFFGGPGIESCTGIVATSRGVWISGATDGSVDLVNPVQDQRKGPSDAFFALFSRDLGTLQFSTLFGSDGSDGAQGLSITPADSDSVASKVGEIEHNRGPWVWLGAAGYTDGAGLPVTENAYEPAHIGGKDFFLVRYKFNYDQLHATYDYATYGGSSGDDVPTSLIASRHTLQVVGWTTAGGWNTEGRPALSGSVDGFLSVFPMKSDATPVIDFVGPSTTYNLPLRIAKGPLHTSVIGGYAAVPSSGTAFMQAFNYSKLNQKLSLLATQYSGGSGSADCNTVRADEYCWACGGKTSGAIETTPTAIQSTFKGGQFDMFGAAYATPWTYYSLFNLTTAPFTGTKNGTPADTIDARSPGRIDLLSWNTKYTYILSNGMRDYQFDKQFDETASHVSFTYLLPDQALSVDAPQVDKDQIGILAYNELATAIDVIRTDQTTEHNEIKRTTVDPGQFFFAPLPKDQNLGISDGVNLINYTFSQRKYHMALPYLFGVLQASGGKSGSSQGFELVLYEMDGDPVELPVTTATQDAEIVPVSFVLETNHPNPFSRSTTIQYEIPKLSTVRLTVYDIMGRRVRTLVDELRVAGKSKIEWDGRDEAGRQMASGTYLARLESGGRSITKTMVLAR